MRKRYVRITSDGCIGFARIVDAETGEPIDNVTHVTIDMPPGGPFVATLTMYAEVDIVAEVRAFELRLPPTDRDDGASCLRWCDDER